MSSALATVPTMAPARAASSESAHGTAFPFFVFAAWVALTLTLIVGHEMWRDEVRALSLAIDPPTLGAMVEGLRGEGHPVLWYLILRTSYGITGSVLVLPVAAFLAAAAAMAFLLWRAPFEGLVKILIAASAFAAIEYTVLARNYGISMLPLFLFAARYDTWRHSGIGLGLVLCWLANTNVHSAILAAALLGMWLVETVSESGLRWSRPLRVFLVNAAIAGSGLLFAAFVVSGPRNDAVSSMVPRGGVGDALWALVDPGTAFLTLAPSLTSGLLSGLLFACLLRFVKQPALLLAGLGSLLLLSLLFTVGYPGQYRHTAIWPLLLICLLWIAEGRKRHGEVSDGLFVSAGRLAIMALLAFQVALTVNLTVKALRSPWSGSREAATVLKADPRLSNAIVLAEPDFLVEPLRYYGIDRTYLVREGRFGRVVNFTRAALLDMSLGELLEAAERLKREHSSEVVILLGPHVPLDTSLPSGKHAVGYNWELTTTPSDVADFLARTERIGTVSGSLQGEDFGIFRLR